MKVQPKKKNIRELSLEEMKEFFSSHGEKAFRAKQLYEWLWMKSARNFDAMTNLSKDLRELLKEHFSLPAVVLSEEQISADKTIKNAFKLADGNVTEGVLIPANDRMTACISSQVGCSLA